VARIPDEVDGRIRVAPFEQKQLPDAIALWRALFAALEHVDDAEIYSRVFAPDEAVERIRYAVERDGALVATVFTSRDVEAEAPNRRIQIAVRLEDIGEWLAAIFTRLAELDRDRAQTWQIVATQQPQAAVLTPWLEAAGFALQSSTLRMTWEGDCILLVDPSPIRLTRYAGGDPAFDQAIVDLHNRAYGRLVPRARRDELWLSWHGLETREFVLALDGDRIVGYAEWWVIDGEAWVNSIVAARSHWGTPVAAALGANAMHALLERGYRKMGACTASTNAPSLKLQKLVGWRVAGEDGCTYVRRF